MDNIITLNINSNLYYRFLLTTWHTIQSIYSDKEYSIIKKQQKRKNQNNNQFTKQAVIDSLQLGNKSLSQKQNEYLFDFMLEIERIYKSHHNSCKHNQTESKCLDRFYHDLLSLYLNSLKESKEGNSNLFYRRFSAFFEKRKRGRPKAPKDGPGRKSIWLD